MKKSLLMAALLSVISSANATGASNNCNGKDSCSEDSTSTVINQGGSAQSHNYNVNTQLQGQAQSTENSNNASQSTSFVDNEARNPVNTSTAPSMSPSAQCMGVATGGAQTFGFGFSLGKSYESKPCNQRELARMFYLIGKSDAAMKVLCSMDGASVVKECK
jgi:hypothetical protein